MIKLTESLIEVTRNIRENQRVEFGNRCARSGSQEGEGGRTTIRKEEQWWSCSRVGRRRRLDRQREGRGESQISFSDKVNDALTASLETHQVINEDGLPIFDIREDLPPEPEASPAATSSSSNSADATKKKPMRYLVKKGGKQVVRTLPLPLYYLISG